MHLELRTSDAPFASCAEEQVCGDRVGKLVGRNFYLFVRKKLSEVLNNVMALFITTLPGVGHDVVVAFRAILSFYPNLLD